jgi:hypothetical protein
MTVGNAALTLVRGRSRGSKDQLNTVRGFGRYVDRPCSDRASRLRVAKMDIPRVSILASEASTGQNGPPRGAPLAAKFSTQSLARQEHGAGGEGRAQRYFLSMPSSHRRLKSEVP